MVYFSLAFDQNYSWEGMMNPKVFICHASEDKAFVLPFATRLREQGVSAWIDTWEIALGDSLMRRIFNKGLAEADVVLAEEGAEGEH